MTLATILLNTNGVAPVSFAFAAVGVILGFIVAMLIYSPKYKATVAEYKGKLESEEKKVEEAKNTLASRERELEGIRKQTVELQKSESEYKTRLEGERKSSREKEQLLENAQAKFSDTFKALSSDALKANQEQFLQLAKTSLNAQQTKAATDLDKRRVAVEMLVKPVAESLEKVQGRIGDLEKAREGAYASLKEQVSSMTKSQYDLQRETAQLVKALRQPTGRGQWGEMQLKRVVEMAGMQEHCDFVTQSSTTTDEGKKLRPDLVVNLPGGQHIVVDSKAPMDAYLDALDVDDEKEKNLALIRHAAQVRTHIQQLGAKKYQEQFETTPEFVVLFLPSEAFFSAALNQDSSLIEKGVEQGVILATPTTLIALLKAVAYGWKQETLTENAQEISIVGKELYTRLSKFAGDIDKMGKSLSTTVNHFNTAVGSFDSRVLSSARKFETLGAAPEQTSISESQPIDKSVRELKSKPVEARNLPVTDVLVSTSLEKEVQEDTSKPYMEIHSPIPGVQVAESVEALLEQEKTVGHRVIEDEPISDFVMPDMSMNEVPKNPFEDKFEGFTTYSGDGDGV